jgi:hypothetical protein
VETCYQEQDYQTWQGFRLLATAGSQIRLPETKEITQQFCQIRYANQRNKVKGYHTYSQARVPYDLCNHLALKAYLGEAHAYEIDLAITPHLPGLPPDSLLTPDRAYATHLFLSPLAQLNHPVVIRGGVSLQTASIMK